MFKKSQFKTKHEYLFLFGVGGLYLFAINRAILSATVIEITALGMFAIGMLCMLAFTAMLFNRFTRIATVAVLVLAALFLLWRREAYEGLFHHFRDVFLMTTGYLPYAPELGQTLMWLIIIALSFTTVVFMLYRFSFYVLALGGGLIFTLSWTSSFIRDTGSFLVFLFAFVLLFIRKMNKNISAVATVAPLCLGVILLAQIQMPAYSEHFTRRTLRDAFEGRLTAVEDFFFELFNPTYFSFAATGFGGGGGRLGGPVTPNNRHVMEVSAPGALYLRGVASNHYTGFSWLNTLQDGDIYTQGMDPGHFEMMENAQALMRGAGLTRGVSALSGAVLRSEFTRDNARYLHVNNFAVVGMYAQETFNLEFCPTALELQERIFTQMEERLMSTQTRAHITLDFDVPIVCPYYLEWQAAWLETAPNYGTMPVPNAFGRVRYYWHAYLPVYTVSIAMGRNRTGTVFRPPGVKQVWFDGDSNNYLPVLQTAPSGDLRTPGFMGRNTVYHQQFLHINPSLSFIEDILHASQQGLYAARGEAVAAFIEAWMEPLRDRGVIITQEQFWRYFHFLGIGDVFNAFAHHGIDTTDVGHYFSHRGDMESLLDIFTWNALAAYAESVRAHFLYVPDSVPQRVHDLTAQLIRYEQTDFGRVTAIRDFLLTSFPYTLDPVPVPRGVCFVDFFLFEGQEGYCTYFASAMAIMSRIAGVPSRYIEGFFVPGTGRNEYALSVVTNRMAHAWVEVYLEGFGWLIMEATPPHAQTVDALAQGRFGFGGPVAYWDEFIYEYDWWMYYYMRQHGGTGPGGGVGFAGQQAGGEDEGDGIWELVLFVAFLTGGLGGILFLYLLFCRLRFNHALKRVARLGNNRQAQAYFKGILNISEYYHLPLNAGETTLGYARRAGKRFAFQSDAVFLRDLIALYNRAKYGKAQISDEDLALMKDSYFTMLALLESMRMRPHFVYLKYVRRVGALA
ncbi:MAG: transglutaminase domain-containing protein [Defluviitaleaceae bacterium]|nr:transglutaminase domain-containing protein [Defluviitaleaceae bacterium]MCL2239161.1 transglutaminase domain-containing protein [Defluviitaleaceae bacterium]